MTNTEDIATVMEVFQIKYTECIHGYLVPNGVVCIYCGSDKPEKVCRREFNVNEKLNEVKE